MDSAALLPGGHAVRDMSTAPTATPTSPTPTLARRVQLPPFNTSTAPPGLIEAVTVDPWSQSDKYSRGWIYFCLVLLVFAFAVRLYHLWGDKVRAATSKQAAQERPFVLYSPDTPYEMSDLPTDRSTNKLFPRGSVQLPSPVAEPKPESNISSFRPLNLLIALFRALFYRPLPVFRLRKKSRPFALPSLAVLVISFAALCFVTLYCFVPQPLYWQRISYGSPPLAIRSGMIACSMIPWLVALSMKANLITLITGIGHERLVVLHRWGGWLCLFLALLHTIPFYVQPIWDRGGYRVFRSFFNTGIYIYGTGFAALVPLCFLCLHSLPILRNWMYELFVAVHVPAAIIFLAMMFWHCNNYLTSWDYLFATVAIWLLCYLYRVIHLNWAYPWRLSWLVGDEASVFLMDENAIKVTIPTQMRWRPGQYVYLRMPGISVFENHPFTICSLCSDDFPSEYGDEYRDMVLVFRPFKGFTKKVLNSAIEKGPWHSYRAFLDGPYGGLSRELDSFEHVVLIAGGSGITALVSNLLHLIKRMRDGKAATKRVQVVWALKRPEIMEWFKEELRICREFAPPDSVQCQFYITAAKRLPATGQLVSAQTPSRPMHGFHDRVDAAFQEIAHKRYSHFSENLPSSRHSALIRDEANGDPEKEAELRREQEDGISALPQAHFVPVGKPSASGSGSGSASGSASSSSSHVDIPAPIPVRHTYEKRGPRDLALDIEAATATQQGADTSYFVNNGPGQFNFGFPTTPTEFQKSLMRFAFLPGPTSGARRRDGWSIEYGRPDVPFFLRQASKEFGRRTAVFVCGPPSMRVDVQRTVAELQSTVLRDSNKDELFLHTENYSL